LRKTQRSKHLVIVKMPKKKIKCQQQGNVNKGRSAISLFHLKYSKASTTKTRHGNFTQEIQHGRYNKIKKKN